MDWEPEIFVDEKQLGVKSKRLRNCLRPSWLYCTSQVTACSSAFHLFVFVLFEFGAGHMCAQARGRWPVSWSITLESLVEPGARLTARILFLSLLTTVWGYR